jgi:hypothetical protein
VICDSEEDSALNFGGIGMAIRKARFDFGADVALDLRPLQNKKGTEYSASPCVVGSLVYPEDPENPGTVVYIKSPLTGYEPADVLNSEKQHPVFPHDSTTDQWFTESQLESYRRLGHHVGFSVFEPAGKVPLVDCTDEQDAQARETPPSAPPPALTSVRSHTFSVLLRSAACEREQRVDGYEEQAAKIRGKRKQ